MIWLDLLNLERQTIDKGPAGPFKIKRYTNNKGPARHIKIKRYANNKGPAGPLKLRYPFKNDLAGPLKFGKTNH